MNIALIGGLDRNEAELVQAAAHAGHRLETHTGVVGGRGANELQAVIARSDFVIICTDVNSHGGVQLAKKVAHRLGRGALVVRKCGASRFRGVLEALAVREQNAFAATG